MRFYWPIAKIDQETRMVYGYASTEALDDQGEVIRREAIGAALDDYMKFANIREMHQPSAVGVAKEAQLDEKGLYLGAKIVDEEAWQKVVAGVYKGFSIGGRVTGRDPQDRKVITGLSLSEISVVDRPANPEAVFDCWKRAGGDSAAADDVVDARNTSGQGAGAAGAAPLNSVPIMVWHCGDPEHRHLKKDAAASCMQKRAADGAAAKEAELQAAIAAVDGGAAAEPVAKAEGDKPYGDVPYADPGYQDDKKKRYPIDSEAHIRAAWSYINKPRNAGKYSADQVEHIKAKIVAAWKAKIDAEGPAAASQKTASSLWTVEEARQFEKMWDAVRGGAISDLKPLALAKHLMDAGCVANMIMELDWLADCLAVEAAREGDDSPAASHARRVNALLCDLLNEIVAEGTREILAGTEDDRLAMAAAGGAVADQDVGGRDKPGQGVSGEAGMTTKNADGSAAAAAQAAAASAAAPAATPAAVVDEPAKIAAASPEDLAKVLGSELHKIVGEQLAGALAPVREQLDRLGADVETIKKQPLPAQTIAVPAALGLTAISKVQDNGGAADGAVELSDDELTARIAKMSPEERTLLMIKASRLRPIPPPGLGTATQLRAAGE